MTDDERAVHPSAAIFPRLSGDELRELADDIKANGLHHPIVLDSDERIVDGINRYMACEIAGVEPTFITLPVNTDIVAYIVSENVRRRNMSKGQLAMAIAALIDTEEGKRDGQTKTLRLESNLSRAHITQAVTIRRYASDLAPAVLAGTETFDAAYRAATARKRQQEDADQAAERQAREDAIELERLRRAAPDLAALVPGTLTVADAKATLAQREQREREERESMARVADIACGFFDPGTKTTSDELAGRIISKLDSAALSTRPVFTAARFARCAETAAAIARRLESQEVDAHGHAATRRGDD